MLLFVLCVSLFVVSMVPGSYPDLSNKMCIDWSKPNAQGTKRFVNEIYNRYGKKESNGQWDMNRAGFDRLLKSLGLGVVVVKCRPDDDECMENKLAFHSLTSKREIKERGRRAASNDKEDEEDHHDEEEEEKEMLRKHEKHWQKHIKECFISDSLFTLNDVNISDGLSQREFVRMCPSLIQQIDAKICVHHHKKMEHHTHVPTTSETWGYGFVSITIISLLSLSVIAVIPCLKKSYYVIVMAFLVALAVGTLAGDALLHLIPHAFVEGANSATNATLSESDKLQQHYSQVWRALFVLLGLYIFFIVEQLMTLKALYGKENGHTHGSNNKSLENVVGDDTKLALAIGDDVEMNPGPNEKRSLSCTSDLHNDHAHEVNEEGHYHADDRHHHHHHDEKNITKETKIASVAWMVIVGDGFHNFSDGLAIGAAFSASLSSGISTAIAVFCHELPHELGDFAILVQSGMTVKQAIVYNLVSAVLAYCGLAIGILVGGNELGRHFILSITAGMFLYVSLADMLPELTHQDIPRASRCVTFVSQHIGMLTGIGIMLIISLYEHDM